MRLQASMDGFTAPPASHTAPAPPQHHEASALWRLLLLLPLPLPCASACRRHRPSTTRTRYNGRLPYPGIRPEQRVAHVHRPHDRPRPLGKRVLIRQDLNVPIENGRITSEQRITASLPTLKRALEQGAR